MRTHHVLIAGAAALGLALALVLGWAAGRGERRAEAAAPGPGAVTAVADLSEGVARVSPAVVMVSAGGRSARDALPMGSGLVVSPDGLMVTSARMTGALREILVIFPDGAAFKAERMGEDKPADVAVFRILGASQQALPAARLGDSDKARAGEPAVLLAEPGGLVTSGVVSGGAPRLGEAAPGLIWTDAERTPTGLGAPLLTAGGGVIGLAASRGQGGRMDGLTAVTPANDVKRILERFRGPPA